MLSLKEGSDIVINIYTFGEFDILVNHNSIVHFMGNSVRLIRLFK